MHARNSNTCTLWLALAALAAAVGAPASAYAAKSAAPGATRVDFGKDAIQPKAAQIAAIRRASGGQIEGCSSADQNCYRVAATDLDGDGRTDLLVSYDTTGYCGSSGCSGLIVMATADGYASKGIRLPNFGQAIDILPDKHHGMHDLHFVGYGPVWKWNGKAYD